MIKYFGKGKPVRIWCQDESRFGLITMQGRMITLKRVKPLAKRNESEAIFMFMESYSQQQANNIIKNLLASIATVFKSF